MFGHTALSGHFIILMAMCLYAYREKYQTKPLKKVLSWTLLLGLASTIHLYFIPMVVIIMVATFIVEFIENKKTVKISIITFVDACIFALLIIALLGGFSGDNGFAYNGVGEYNINLNTLINPHGMSGLLQDFGSATYGEWEGIGYLGFGIFLLIFASIILFTQNISKKEIIRVLKNPTSIFIGICVITSIIVAVGSSIKINSRIVCNIPYPSFIMKILEIFRANGRFIWIASYSIFFASICFAYKYSSKRVANTLIIICLFIQIVDFRAAMINKFNYDDHVSYEESKNNFEKVLDGSKHMACLQITDSNILFEMAYIALNNNCTMNNFYFARPIEGIEEIEQQYLEDILNSVKNDDFVYIIPKESEELTKTTKLNCYRIGNYIAITSKDIQELENVKLEHGGTK